MKTSRTILITLLFAAASGASAGTINVPADQPTIQAAINAATAGDTILVAPGTYDPFIVSKAVTVKSTSGPEVTIVTGGVKTISIQANNVTVQGFKVTNPAVGAPPYNPVGPMLKLIGIDIGAPAATLSGVRVLGNIVAQIGAPGRTLASATTDSPSIGINLSGACTALEIGNNVISNIAVTVSGAAYGPYGACGILVAGVLPAVTTGSIHDNLVRDIRTIQISGATAAGEGILATCAAGAVTLARNDVRNATGVGLDATADASGAIAMTDNTVIGCGTGIRQNSPAGGDLLGNIVSLCATGIDIGPAPTSLPVIHNCALTGNGLGLLNRNAAQVNAQANWWGGPAGPSRLAGADPSIATGDGDKVGSNVDFSLWLAAKPAQANVLYLLPNSGSLYIQPGMPVIIDMNVANLTTKVNACQAMLGYSSSFFADPSAVVGAVQAGGGVWSELIYDSWKDSTGVAGNIDTAIGLNAQSAVGTDVDGRVAIITLTSRPALEGTTQIIFRTDPSPDAALTASTFLTTLASDPLWPAKVNSANLYIDGTAPVMADAGIAAVESQPYVGVQDVKNATHVTVQGTVNITVQASDALSGLTGAPTVALANGANNAAAAYVNESPAGTFNYTWAVTPTTANGTWTATVTATDKSGNSTVRNFTLAVNKNQIAGQIALEGFVGASRNVTFVTTGASKKSWTLPLTGYVGGVASYVCTDVPDGTTGISAKNAWSLRRKIATTLDANGQATVNFTGASLVKGGDLNGSNSINIQDYSLLKVVWMSSNAAADINGDGMVQALDYGIMKANWFTSGDPE